MDDTSLARELQPEAGFGGDLHRLPYRQLVFLGVRDDSVVKASNPTRSSDRVPTPSAALCAPASAASSCRCSKSACFCVFDAYAKRRQGECHPPFVDSQQGKVFMVPFVVVLTLLSLRQELEPVPVGVIEVDAMSVTLSARHFYSSGLQRCFDFFVLT